MLFLKEWKKVICSLTFVLYFAAVLAMYFTQFHSDCSAPMEQPQPGSDNYGMIVKEIPELMMPEAIDSLISEYLSGSFKAYPIGFYKDVKLKENEKAEMSEIIYELSGITREELDHFTEFKEEEIKLVSDGQGGFTAESVEPVLPEVVIPEDLTYDHFRELMRQADDIIGGGSKYGDDAIVGNFSCVPKTYEEALAEYNEMIQEDKISGAYARLFCDYIGIVAAILPVFVCASFTFLDRKANMEQLVYARKISSVKLIVTRYIVLCISLMLPVLIAALIAQGKVMGLYPNMDIDLFAMVRYAILWITPNVMLSVSIGMLFTELLSPLIAILIQGICWFMSIFSNTGSLSGNIGRFTLVVRHNSLLKRDLFFADYNKFLFNRSFYIVLSVLMAALTVVIYERKRRGQLHGFFRIQKNSGSKYKA